ncbi:MAG TPA: hypothetical protein VL294_12170 [Pseudolysinimonas sp.]|nr:hypothetical protein [Pseudolysinimonas sp.]
MSGETVRIDLTHAGGLQRGEGWKLTESATWRLAYQLSLMREPMKPTRVTQLYLAGFKAAGVKASLATVYDRSLGRKRSLPMVIQFPCPEDHLTVDERETATVRLLIRPDGSAAVDRPVDKEGKPTGGWCMTCTTDSLEDGMLKCPLCRMGVRSPEHPSEDHRLPRHEDYPDVTVTLDGGWQGSDSMGELWQCRGWVNGQPAVFGSTAVFAFVLMEFEREQRLAHAEWWLRHTAEALADEREFWAEEPEYAVPEDGVPRYVGFQVEWAQRVLGAQERSLEGKPKPTPKVNYSDAEAAAWLDSLKGADGSQLVPVGMALREMWALISPIVGRPAKNIAERGQKLRRDRGTSA